MRERLYPSLYQINTRVWLMELSRVLGRPGSGGALPRREHIVCQSVGCFG